MRGRNWWEFRVLGRAGHVRNAISSGRASTHLVPTIQTHRSGTGHGSNGFAKLHRQVRFLLLHARWTRPPSTKVKTAQNRSRLHAVVRKTPSNRGVQARSRSPSVANISLPSPPSESRKPIRRPREAPRAGDDPPSLAFVGERDERDARARGRLHSFLGSAEPTKQIPAAQHQELSLNRRPGCQVRLFGVLANETGCAEMPAKNRPHAGRGPIACSLGGWPATKWTVKSPSPPNQDDHGKGQVIAKPLVT